MLYRVWFLGPGLLTMDISACYVYIAPLAISRWLLFRKHQLSPMSKRQLPVYIAYMVLFVVFGLYGLFYLWGLAQP